MADDDRRELVRVERILEIEYWADSPPIRARVSDIGEGGAFIDTSTPFEEGTELQFRLPLGDGDEPIRGRARVMWQQPMLGMGIEFVGLDAEQAERVRFFVASVYFQVPLDG